MIITPVSDSLENTHKPCTIGVLHYAGRGGIGMTLDEAAKEFELECKIRHLSPKTIDNYGKQLHYLQRFLEEFSISTAGDAMPSHIKRFLSIMNDAGRKPQYAA